MTQSAFVPPSLLDAGRGNWQALPEDVAHYLVNVLRMSEGKNIQLRDVLGREVRATLIRDPRGVWGAMINGAVAQLPRPLGRQVWMAPALFKQQRFAWLLEKLGELGADRISLVMAEHSVVRWSQDKVAKKLSRYQAILRAATRQSGAHQPPTLDPPVPLEQRVASFSESGAVVLYAHPEATTPFAEHVATEAPLAIFSGPEGGFSRNELKLFEASGALGVHLGQRVLRAETAPIAMLATVRMMDSALKEEET